jgi:hypothetical protein
LVCGVGPEEHRPLGGILPELERQVVQRLEVSSLLRPAVHAINLIAQLQAVDQIVQALCDGPFENFARVACIPRRAGSAGLLAIRPTVWPLLRRAASGPFRLTDTEYDPGVGCPRKVEEISPRCLVQTVAVAGGFWALGTPELVNKNVISRAAESQHAMSLRAVCGDGGSLPRKLPPIRFGDVKVPPEKAAVARCVNVPACVMQPSIC